VWEEISKGVATGYIITLGVLLYKCTCAGFGKPVTVALLSNISAHAWENTGERLFLLSGTEWPTPLTGTVRYPLGATMPPDGARI
jgi:hypothetical protein